MEDIDIEVAAATGMDNIAAGVAGLKIIFVNVFGVVHHDNSWTLIDAALPHSTARIKKWADARFGRAPQAIVLTHGHFDHVGAAADLAAHWNVPVFAHEQEIPYLTGEKAYPAPNWAAGGGAMSLLSPLYPRAPVDLRPHLHELTSDTINHVMPGWEMLHTPGHTPGHVSFNRTQDQSLIVGDAFCTTLAESFFEAAVVQEPHMHGPPAYFTSDWNQARRSVQLLAALNPVTVIPGHGKPLAGPTVAAALRELASKFDSIAVPQNVSHSRTKPQT